MKSEVFGNRIKYTLECLIYYIKGIFGVCLVLILFFFSCSLNRVVLLGDEYDGSPDS